MRGVTVELEPTLEREIKEAQKNDEKISEIQQLILEGRGKDSQCPAYSGVDPQGSS
jgi:hypothetical protein